MKFFTLHALLRQLFFIGVLLGMGSLLPVEIGIKKIKGDELQLEVKLDKSEVLYKDSLRLFTDGKNPFALQWKVLADPVEEYVGAFKLHKKIYKQSFLIQVRLPVGTRSDLYGVEPTVMSSDFMRHDDIGEAIKNLYISCFVINADASVEPILKTIVVGDEHNSVGTVPMDHKKMSQGALESISSPTIPVVEHKNSQGVLRSFFPSKKSTTPDVRGLWLLVIAFVLFLLWVLPLLDLAILFALSSWIYFFCISTKPFSLWLLLGAGFSLAVAMWFFTQPTTQGSEALKKTRIIVGLLCASCVLPLVIELATYRYFEQREMREKKSNIQTGLNARE